jgi:hypothetical protein
MTPIGRRERTDVSLVSSITVWNNCWKFVLSLNVFVPTYFIELNACGSRPTSENLSFSISSADLDSPVGNRLVKLDEWPTDYSLEDQPIDQQSTDNQMEWSTKYSNDCQTDSLENQYWVTDQPTDSLLDCQQTDWADCWVSDWPKNLMTTSPTNQTTGYLINQLVAWLTNQLINCLTD